MKVIHLVSGEASPSARDGVNRVVHQIATAQANNGMAVEVWGISSMAEDEHPQRAHGAEKYLVYADADCFVHASRWEGLPTALLEAAAFGLPLLVSRETNFGGYVEKARCGVYDAEDVQALADGMATLEKAKRDGELPAMGRRARIMADEAFDWERNGKLICDEVYAKSW